MDFMQASHNMSIFKCLTEKKLKKKIQSIAKDQIKCFNNEVNLQILKSLKITKNKPRVKRIQIRVNDSIADYLKRKFRANADFNVSNSFFRQLELTQRFYTNQTISFIDYEGFYIKLSRNGAEKIEENGRRQKIYGYYTFQIKFNQQAQPL